MHSTLKLCSHDDVCDGSSPVKLTCKMLNEFAFHVYISRNNFWKIKSLLACQSTGILQQLSRS